MKDEFGRVIVIEFVGIKSKMYSMKKIDGKECNTGKGVSIATEFDKFKDVLFNEKIIRQKMRRIQSKNINKEHMKLTRYLFHVLTIKDTCQMIEFVRCLIFINIVSQVAKRLKKIAIKEILIKKIEMIEKYCDN